MDDDPDVRFRFDGTTSERVFFAICVMVVIYLAALLMGCAAVFSLHTYSDGNNVTGDFMIGEPHENQQSNNPGNRTFDSEGLD